MLDKPSHNLNSIKMDDQLQYGFPDSESGYSSGDEFVDRVLRYGKPDTPPHEACYYTESITFYPEDFDMFFEDVNVVEGEVICEHCENL